MKRTKQPEKQTIEKDIETRYLYNTNKWCMHCKKKQSCYIGKHAEIAGCEQRGF